MPVMDLLDKNGGLRIDAPLIVFAVMLFPESVERQLDYRLKLMTLAMVNKDTNQERDPLDHEIVQVLLRSLSSKQQGREMRLRYLKGMMAGEVLFLIRHLIKVDPDTASRNKAQYLQREFFDVEYERVLQLRLPKSERAQNDTWRKFSPVAHLWAAFSFLMIFHDTDDSNPLGIFDIGCVFDDVSDLLVIAEVIRKMGEEFVPTGQRPTPKKPATTVLDPERTWKLPEGLELPEAEVNLLFDGQLSSVLKRYNYSKLFGLK